MLEITIPKTDLWDEEHEKFISIEKTDLQLEHSLVSISKWESKWHKPFMVNNEKSNAELLDYIKCMTLSENVKDEVYYAFNDTLFNAINDYIDDPMTATKFSEIQSSSGYGEVITSEIIYYKMCSFNIPVEFQNWHINRLITLIRIFDIKNSPAKKMSQSELIRRQAEINEMRRKKYNTKG